MIEIKLTFATLELAITAMAAVRAAEGKSDAPKPAPAEAAAPATKPAKETKPAKAAETAPTAAATPPAASPTPPTESPSPTTSSDAAAKPKTSRDAMAAAIKAGVAVNREAVVATLTKFGAKAGKDLKDEQLDAFMADLETALKPVDDLS